MTVRVGFVEVDCLLSQAVNRHTISTMQHEQRILLPGCNGGKYVMSGSHECYLFCLTTTNIRKLLINQVQILPQIAQLISNFSLVRAFHTAILWLYEKPWFQVRDSIWHSMYSLLFSINMRFILGGKCLVVCQSF